ncbi:MAG: hypothetical protein K1X78_06090 [Verrucomicrobiaceae bacterium]|nr:hypothetical protein [Verrucomicrobiaceae bacterium]
MSHDGTLVLRTESGHTLARRSFLQQIASWLVGAAMIFRPRLAKAAYGIPVGHTVVSVRPNDRRLYVRDRRPDGTLGTEYAFNGKGVNWAPNRVGMNPGSNPSLYRQEFFNYYQEDIPKMAAMGINLVRLYYDMGTTVDAIKVLDMFYQYGIKVIMPVTAPLYGDTANYGNITTVVEGYKNHPAILMWAIGNEWDINHYDNHFQNITDSIAFTIQAAQRVRLLDTTHAIITIYGDPHLATYHPLSQEAFPFLAGPYTKDIWNQLSSYVDIFGLNIYRSDTYADLFQQVASITTKGVMITEAGTDSYNWTTQAQDEAMQALTATRLHDEAFLSSASTRVAGVNNGSVYFMWRDDWSKLGYPAQHDHFHGDNPGHPDGTNQEEDFGFLQADGTPKQVVSALGARFAGDQLAVASNASPLISITSQDGGSAVSARIDGKTVFYRNGGGDGARGVNVFVLDSASGIRVKDFQNFDTYVAPNRHADLVNYLNSLPNGAIVMIGIADEGGFVNRPWDGGGAAPSAAQTKTLLSSTAWGSTEVSNILFRSGWAFIAKKGTGKLAEALSGANSPVTVQAQPSLTLNPDDGRREPYAVLSKPVVINELMGAQGFELTFNSEPDVVYLIEYTDDLQAPWKVAIRGVVADDTTMTFIDHNNGILTLPANATRRFYRITPIDRVCRAP